MPLSKRGSNIHSAIGGGELPTITVPEPAEGENYR